jgi:hypothetical protein
MSERKQIVSQSFTRTADTKEVKKMLKRIKKHFELHRFPNIELFYTKDCCHKYAMLAKPFPELADECLLWSATNATGLAKFDFDNTFPQLLVRVLSTIDKIEDLLGIFLQCLIKQDKKERSLTFDLMPSGASGIVNRSRSQYSLLLHTGKMLLLL